MEFFEFKKDNSTGFSYFFGKDLKAGDTIIVKMPAISANKRGVNDIGWICNGNVKVEGTLAKDPKSNNALWQEINDYDEINKVISAIRIRNIGTDCRIEMRAILN